MTSVIGGKIHLSANGELGEQADPTAPRPDVPRQRGSFFRAIAAPQFLAMDPVACLEEDAPVRNDQAVGIRVAGAGPDVLYQLMISDASVALPEFGHDRSGRAKGLAGGEEDR